MVSPLSLQVLSRAVIVLVLVSRLTATSLRNLRGQEVSITTKLDTSAATSPTQYCPGGSWASAGANDSFDAGPCLMVSGIGVVQTPSRTILIMDRSDNPASYLYLGDGTVAAAEELDLEKGTQRAVKSSTPEVATTGQFNNDGVFLSIGGPAPNQTQFSLRKFVAGALKTAAKLTSRRWYATSQILADGRMIIVGGASDSVDINSKGTNVATIEYYPRPKKQKAYPVPFLESSLPYNLYPHVHLLPSGRVFIFGGNGFVLWDTTQNSQVGAVTNLVTPGKVQFSNFPLTGTSVLFPLSSANGWAAEIMICGGSYPKAKSAPGVPGSRTVKASNLCARIQPESQNPQWAFEYMKQPRIMPNAVLLPDSTVLILNGQSRGFAGYGGYPKHWWFVVRTPELYDTNNKSWVTSPPLATAAVPRLFQSSAILLHNATVFVSGGNPQPGIGNLNKFWGTKFKSEVYTPPYLQNPGSSNEPHIISTPVYMELNAQYAVKVVGPPSAVNFKVVLCQPGFSTYGHNHGMRNVELDIVHVSGPGFFTLTVQTPSSNNIAPPTFYWLFVLIDGIPSLTPSPTYIVTKTA